MAAAPRVVVVVTPELKPELDAVVATAPRETRVVRTRCKQKDGCRV